MTIDSHNEPEPDISILRKRGDSYTESHPRPADILVVIEVAESSIAFDQGVKKDLYARAGIDTYMIVNLIEQQVELYTAPRDGDFTGRQILKKGDSFTLLGQLLKTSEIVIA